MVEEAQAPPSSPTTGLRSCSGGSTVETMEHRGLPGPDGGGRAETKGKPEKRSDNRVGVGLGGGGGVSLRRRAEPGLSRGGEADVRGRRRGSQGGRKSSQSRALALGPWACSAGGQARTQRAEAGLHLRAQVPGTDVPAHTVLLPPHPVPRTHLPGWGRNGSLPIRVEILVGVWRWAAGKGQGAWAAVSAAGEDRRGRRGPIERRVS